MTYPMLESDDVSVLSEGDPVMPVARISTTIQIAPEEEHAMTDPIDPIEAAREEVVHEVRANPGCIDAVDGCDHCAQIAAALDALIAVVEREQAASMPCRTRPEGCRGDSWTVDPPCESCTARAEKADAKEQRG